MVFTQFRFVTGVFDKSVRNSFHFGQFNLVLSYFGEERGIMMSSQFFQIKESMQS